MILKKKNDITLFRKSKDVVFSVMSTDNGKLKPIDGITFFSLISQAYLPCFLTQGILAAKCAE